MATVGDLIVNLSADVASFRSGMDQAGKSLQDFGRTAKQTQNSIAELTDWVKGLAGVQFIEFGMKIAEQVKSFTEGAAELAAMSRQVGMSAEDLQTFQVMATKASVSQQTLNTAIEYFTANIGKLREGISDPQFLAGLKDVWGSLDAASKASQNMGTAAFIEETRRRTAEILAEGDAYRANADARALFSRRGEEMLRIEDQAADSFDKMKQAAKDLGLVLTDEDIGAMSKVDEEIALEGRLLKNELAEGLLAVIPLWRDFKDAVVGVAGEIKSLAASSLGPFGGFQPFGAGFGYQSAAAGSPEMLALMSAHQGSGPAPWESGGSAKPPPLIDAEAVKKAQEFAQEYQKLIDQYQLDLDYQTRLRAAYAQNAEAVRALEVAHAGELAAEKVRQDAARLGITVTEQQIKAITDLAASDEQAKKIVSDYTAFLRPYQELLDRYREDIDYQTRLRAAYSESADAVRALQIAHAGELAAQNEYNAAQKLGIELSQEQVRAVYDLASADEQAKLEAQENRKAQDQFTTGIDQGLTKAGDALLKATTNSRNLKSAWQELSQGAISFADDLEKMILKLVVINPLINSLMGKNPGDQGALPTAGNNLFGGLLNGGSTRAGAGGGGGAGGLGGLLGSGIKDIAGYLGADLSNYFDSSDAQNYASIGSLFGGLFASADAAGAPSSDLNDFASAMMSNVIPGFAGGGEFTVGGSGGTDSQLVAFRATPGERVMVRTPEAAAAGGAGAAPQINMTVVTPDVSSFRQAHGQIIADAYRHIATAAARHA